MTAKSIFPFLKWFKDYNSNYFKLDLVAGVTVALVIIPQSMAYAQLAGLPVQYGLYASLLPLLVAALFGSSRQLSTGPVAIVSLMTASTLEPLARMGSTEFIAYAILLSLIVGLFQLALGTLRLGLIINLLSLPVVNGFTNAAAIIIATSQLSKLFGVYSYHAHHHYETIYVVIEEALQYTHLPTLLMGLLAFAIMILIKKYFKKLPYVLIAVVITTLISYFTGFERNITTTNDNIKSERTKDLFRELETSYDTLNVLAEELTRATKRVEQLRADEKITPLQLLQEENLMEAMEFQVYKLNERINDIKFLISSLHFNYAVSPDGSHMFFEKGKVPSSCQSDDRIWRVKLGYGKIDTNAILLAGGGEVVGHIPQGLPVIKMPEFDGSIFTYLIPYAIIISLLGFMEAIAIAKAIASKTGQKVDANQELIGQGLGNIVGAFSSSYPVSGSFSRSAVNYRAGAVTGMSNVFTCVVVGLTLLYFTPLLYYLPQSVLAAIIIMAVIGLINFKEIRHAWKAKWYDGLIAVITFIATLFLAPHLEKGIYIGVALSVGVILYRSMRPKISSLSRYYDLSLRDSEFHQLDECEYISLIRFGGPLIFSNAHYLEEEINKRMRQKPKLKCIIVVCNSINDLDASGEAALSLLIDRVRSAGYRIMFSGLNETVLAVMQRTGLYEKIGKDNIFPTMEKAITAVLRSSHGNQIDEECPLLAMHHLLYFKSEDLKGLKLKQKDDAEHNHDNSIEE
jgi:MFS superfamily sulfate permease-like transporter